MRSNDNEEERIKNKKSNNNEWEADVMLWSESNKRKAKQLRSPLKTRMDGVQLPYLRYQNVILLPYEQFDKPFIDTSSLT